MSTPFLSYLQAAAPALQDAADGYSRNAVATAVASRDQQIATLQGQLSALQALEAKDATSLLAAQQQLASVQTQLATALANDSADRAQIATYQRQVADLQSQLLALQPGKAPPPPAGYAEAFRDDMTAKLGPGWSVADNDYAGNELSTRLAANVVGVAGMDFVSIRAKRQTVGSRLFSSGYLTTTGHCSVPYGKWLARMRWSDLYGLWPAFWLRFDNAVGEIDGMEAVGLVRKIVQTAHQNTSGTQDKCGYEWVMPAGWLPSDWHVYGVERRSNGVVVWTIDGLITRSIAPEQLSTKLHQPMSWLTGPEYAGPAHLIINLQVGGTMPAYYGQTDQSKILPGFTVGSLDIDWVQVLTPLAAA